MLFDTFHRSFDRFWSDLKRSWNFRNFTNISSIDRKLFFSSLYISFSGLYQFFTILCNISLHYHYVIRSNSWILMAIKVQSLTFDTPYFVLHSFAQVTSDRSENTLIRKIIIGKIKFMKWNRSVEYAFCIRGQSSFFDLFRHFSTTKRLEKSLITTPRKDVGNL